MTTQSSHACSRRPAILIILAASAIGLMLWKLATAHPRWQAVCALAFSPDGQTLAAGLYEGEHFNENIHWCIANLHQTVTLFDAQTGSGEVLHEARFPR